MSQGLWIADERQRLLLASQSITRQRMLSAAGLVFETIAAPIDERALQDDLVRQGARPQVIAERLAGAKAIAASRTAPEALVLAADQTLDLDGTLGVKPRDMVEARSQLARMAGRPHRLHSAFCFAREGAAVAAGSQTAVLEMRALTATDIDAYLDAAGPAVLGSVGCYQVESLGVHLFERIDGDWFTILGLPLLPVVGFLRSQGLLR